MKLFGKKHGDDVLIAHLYDIGSASVGGAIVVFRPEKKPFIAYATRKEMNFQEAPDVIRFQHVLFSSVSAVAEDLQKNGGPIIQNMEHASVRPQSILCTLSSPWYVSQTRCISKTYKRPTRIRTADINERAEQEYKTFVDSLAVKSLGEGEYTLIEQRIIQVKLNGYETSVPDGKEVSSLDMTVIFSVTSSNIVQGITGAIERSFTDCPIEFSTCSLTAFDALRGKKKIGDDILFVDVSGEVTDVSLINDGVLIESVSFPVGKYTLLRSITQSLGTTHDEALSLLRLHNETGVSGQDAKRVTDALSSAVAVWNEAFNDVLSNISEELSIPQHIYMMSDQDSEVWLSSMIGEENMPMRGGTYSVTPVNAVFLNDLCEVSRDTLRDSFLMIEAMFAERSLGSGSTTGVHMK